MRSMRMGQSVLAAASAALLWAMAPGCGGPSITGFCDKVCDCTGCNETERTECADAIEDSQKAATEKNCSGQWDTYFACVDNEATCVNDTIDADGCETEAKDLVDCAGPISIGSTTCQKACEAGQKCDGGNPTDCKATCAAGLQELDETGCRPEYDAYLECYLALPDVCNPPSGACIDEAGKFTNCYTKFCSANPDAAACQN